MKDLKTIKWNVRYGGLTKPEETLRCITFGKGVFVTVGDVSLTQITPPVIVIKGNEFKEVSVPLNTSLYTVIFGNGKFVAMGKDGVAIVSDDAYVWKKVNTGAGIGTNFVGSCFWNNVFYGCASDGKLFQSPNGETWSEIAINNGIGFKKIRATATGVLCAMITGKVGMWNGSWKMVQVGATNFQSCTEIGGYYFVGGGANKAHELFRTKNPTSNQWELLDGGIGSEQGPYYQDLIDVNVEGKDLIFTCGDGNWVNPTVGRAETFLAISDDYGKTFQWSQFINDYSTCLSLAYDPDSGRIVGCGARGMIIETYITDGIVEPPVEPPVIPPVIPPIVEESHIKITLSNASGVLFEGIVEGTYSIKFEQV